MRTHLLTGPGGAGVSSMAAALAAALADPGGAVPAPSVTLACIGDDGSLSWLLGPDPEVALVDLAGAGPWGELDDALAATIERFGGDGDIAEEWRRLPGADLVAALVALGEAVAVTDVLVVDVGDLRRAGQFLAAAQRMPWVLRGLLGLQAYGVRLLGPTAAHAVPRWLDALEAAAEVLRAPDTRLHLVAGAEPLALAKIRRGVPQLLLAGAGPGVLVRCPDDDRQADPATGAVPGPAYDWAPFTPVTPMHWPVDATGRLRPDAGAAVAPLVGAFDRLVTLSADIHRTAEHLTWRVPLPWVRAKDIQLEHRGEDLVVTVHGVPHLLRPPAVVRRCTPVQSRLDGTYLQLEFILREGSWQRHER